jgi:hypothetical protein
LNGTPVLSDQAYTNPTLVDVDRVKFRTGSSTTVSLTVGYLSGTRG